MNFHLFRQDYSITKLMGHGFSQIQTDKSFFKLKFFSWFSYPFNLRFSASWILSGYGR